MSFVAECIQDSLPIWEQCLNSQFLLKLENGTLEESSFLGYIIDDSLYLREYAKVFTWGMTKAQTMDDIPTDGADVKFTPQHIGGNVFVHNALTVH